MEKQLKLLIAILGLLITVSAAASEETADNEDYFPQQISAEQLLRYCASSTLTKLGRERRKYCSGFVSGVEESLRLLGPRQDASSRSTCVPAAVNARKLAEVYVDYAGLRQDRIKHPAVVIVIESLQHQYPCGENN